MRYYDLELIDVNENVENFSFEKLTKETLDKVIQDYKENKDYVEFECLQGSVILERKYFRGIMHTSHLERSKTVSEETFENAEEIGRIEVVKNKQKVKVNLKEK